jgi:GT2 family glycosyltransferase
MIYIVIPVFNRWQFTQPCLQSLREQTYRNFKVIVVDHGSTDGTSEYINKEFPEALVLLGNESMWWTAATNLGVKYAIEHKADFVLTLNNDLIVKPNYLQILHSLITQHPKAIIGSAVADIKQPTHIVFVGSKWNKYSPVIALDDFETIRKTNDLLECDLLAGRGSLIPIQVFKEIGLFDEHSFPHYAADEDFSLQCKKKGYKLLIALNAMVLSEVGATGLKSTHQKKNINYWKDLFFSQKSAVNLKRRWYWAKKHGSIPPLYFCIDVLRILVSQIKSKEII